MIKLDVEDYCDCCPMFEADVEKDYIDTFGGEAISNTIVSCKYKYMCRAIYKKALKERRGKETD